MTSSKRKPAATDADRLPDGFAVAAETNREDRQVIRLVQAHRLRDRFGLTPTMARLVASLVWGVAHG
jgi:hypothetical protein